MTGDATDYQNFEPRGVSEAALQAARRHGANMAFGHNQIITIWRANLW